MIREKWLTSVYTSKIRAHLHFSVIKYTVTDYDPLADDIITSCGTLTAYNTYAVIQLASKAKAPANAAEPTLRKFRLPLSNHLKVSDPRVREQCNPKG